MTTDTVIRYILTHPDIEGGGKVVADPADPGGLTRFGFSQRQYPGTDIRNLSLEMAVRMAVRDYWIPAKCGQMPMSVGAALFDFEFNSGPVARRILQAALRVKADGVVGIQTIGAAAKQGADVVPLYMALRAQYCQRLTNWPAHGAGWLKRWFTVSQFIGRFS